MRLRVNVFFFFEKHLTLAFISFSLQVSHPAESGRSLCPDPQQPEASCVRGGPVETVGRFPETGNEANSKKIPFHESERL